MMKRICALFLGISLFSSNPAQTFAVIDAFEGIEMATITVKGKEVTFPIANDERKNQIYYLKKSLNGDKEAREIFMGGEKEKWFFIGKHTPLWLKVTEDDVEIIDPNVEKGD